MRVKETMTRYLEEKLFVKANQEKTEVAYITKIKFLGFGFYIEKSGNVRITVHKKSKENGFDMANVINVGKQDSYAMLINSMIAMIHRMFCDSGDEMDKKLFEVRIRKILSYSNLVASSSDLAVVAVTKDMKFLDLGGLAVAIYGLITDAKFIRQIKEEFIFCSYKDMIIGGYLC